MQEIVPPKLNRDTGLLSFVINRRNLIIALGALVSFFLWSNSYGLSVDQKLIIQLLVGAALIPFMFDVYGRPLHIFILDFLKFQFRRKETKIVLAKDISQGVVVGFNNTYSKVYRIEPINLTMSGSEEILQFKRYLQSALFGLKTTVQIITVQRFASQDAGLAVEEKRLRKLNGVLKQRCAEFLVDYRKLSGTMERSFYLVVTDVARDLDQGAAKLIDLENSFVRSLEQTKIKLQPLNSTEIKALSEACIF